MFEVIVPEKRSHMTMIHRSHPCAFLSNRMLYVNSVGMEAIKVPRFIKIGLDTKQHRIIIIPSTKEDVHAYRVQSVKETRAGGRVENYDLVLSMLRKGLPVDAFGHHYTCHTMMDDSILWFDYRKPLEQDFKQLTMWGSDE